MEVFCWNLYVTSCEAFNDSPFNNIMITIKQTIYVQRNTHQWISSWLNSSNKKQCIRSKSFDYNWVGEILFVGALFIRSFFNQIGVKTAIARDSSANVRKKLDFFVLTNVYEMVKIGSRVWIANLLHVSSRNFESYYDIPSKYFIHEFCLCSIHHFHNHYDGALNSRLDETSSQSRETTRMKR